MKKLKYRIIIPVTLVGFLVVYACSKSFTDVGYPSGTINPGTLANKLGIRGLLIGAYSMLDGIGGAGGSQGPWANAGSNWVYGSVCADDSHKGSDPGDQPAIVGLMTWVMDPSNLYLDDVWSARYDGVQRSNDVLRILPQVTDMSDAEKTVAAAESRFLRGHYHFELKKIFGNIPYIDETISYSNGNWRVPNTTDAWPMIEADFQFAYDNLPETQSETGRANKWAAACYLAKAYVFEHKWSEALALLHTINTSGKNAAGQKYALLKNFSDNFNPAKNHLVSGGNETELVFAAVSTVNDGAGANNANAGDVLNFPYGGGPGTCCGFNQPSWALANAFIVDANGLPVSFVNNNNPDLKNDQGIASSDPYTPDTTTPLDPRIDWTIGRRGIPFLDWGIEPGQNWVRNQASAGPYAAVKNTYYKSQEHNLTDNSSWTSGYTANNIMLIRYADVLLWTAEAEVEAGSLDEAQKYVNMVRERVADPTTWVQGSPAKYKIGLYPAGWFAAQGKDVARKAVQYERRVELAMEGHRFFDLARYGTATAELNAYVAHEVNISGYNIIKGATFNDKKIYFPIPQKQIDLSSLNGTPTLIQNSY